MNETALPEQLNLWGGAPNIHDYSILSVASNRDRGTLKW